LQIIRNQPKLRWHLGPIGAGLQDCKLTVTISADDFRGTTVRAFCTNKEPNKDGCKMEFQDKTSFTCLSPFCASFDF
jgi:hypothetical protein